MLRADLLPCPEYNGALFQLLRRQGILQGGIDAGNDGIPALRGVRLFIRRAARGFEHACQYLQALVFIFAGGALHVLQVEVPGRVDQRAQSKRGKVASNALRLGFIRRKEQGLTALACAQGAGNRCFVDAGKPGGGSRQRPGGNGVLQGLIFRQSGKGIP